ncbi:MAG: hypothetical protein KF687_04680 [Cyclobacteriaceae bacterium]|nr:hypothetical protein [Cyclobacteriaceae bacterium]
MQRFKLLCVILKVDVILSSACDKSLVAQSMLIMTINNPYMLFKNCSFILIFCLFFFLIGHVNAQEESVADTLASETKITPTDTIRKTKDKSKVGKQGLQINWNNLPYSFDDIAFMVGVTNSSLYYSNYFRELSFTPGFIIGAEDFFPVFDKAFLHVGLKYAQLGFEHTPYNVVFTTHNIDIPLFLSYELPELRSFDLRLLFGSRFLFRTGSNTKGTYPTSPEIFRFNPTQFSNFDFGFVFGLSAEYKNFYSSARGYTGFIKLIPSDTGMNNSFSLEVGYFIFRNLRK